MIEFLKESTFAVNDVVRFAWSILKRYYVSVAGLCFLMFLIFNMSTLLASLSGYLDVLLDTLVSIKTADYLPVFLLSEFLLILRITMAQAFFTSYLGVQLILFKYILRVLDNQLGDPILDSFKERILFLLNEIKVLLKFVVLFAFCFFVAVSLILLLGFTFNYFTLGLEVFNSISFAGGTLIALYACWKKYSQFIKFLIVAVVPVFFVFLSILLMGAVFFPVIYTGINPQVLISIAISTAILFAFIFGIRISFSPLFIVDYNYTAYKSIRFSMAITRGNFTKLFLLLGVLAFFQLLSLYFGYKNYVELSFVASVINSFLILPLSSVVIAVAYRQMMSEYQGEEDPSIMGNII